MGALNNFWTDNTVDNLSKYIIFCAIPCHLRMLWFESWSMREATLKKLEVFLHRNVRKILKTTITIVIDRNIINQSVRKRFFNIPTIWYQLVKWQLTFIGKVVRNLEDQIPTKLLTAWYNNKRKAGAQLQNNNKNLAQNICLIVPGAAKYGLLTTWVYLALDYGYWKHLIQQLGTHPSTWNGAKPNPHSTPTPRSSQRAAAPSTPPHRQALPNSPPPFRACDSHFTPTVPRHNAPQPSPGCEASPRHKKSPRRTQRKIQNDDPRKIGHNRKDSLGILNIPISNAATEIEIKVHYWRLEIIYHPDKYNPTTNKISKSEAQEHFKLINNAYK